MWDRCYNKDSRGYPYCGAKRIRVCSRWRNFYKFAQDMGPRPKGMFLGRVSSHGHYTPENCRWVVKKQLYNRRPRGQTRHWVRTIVYKARKRKRSIEEAEKQSLRVIMELFRAGCSPQAFMRPRDFRDRASFKGRAKVTRGLYRAGFTVRRIAEMCGLTERAIRKTVKKHGKV
jgi:hypothetical protein